MEFLCRLKFRQDFNRDESCSREILVLVHIYVCFSKLEMFERADNLVMG